MAAFGGAAGQSSSRVIQGLRPFGSGINPCPPWLGGRHPNNVAPPDLPATFYELYADTPDKMFVTHEGGGTYIIEKYDGGATGTYDAGATSTLGIAGDFALKLEVATTISGGWFGGGMDAAPLGSTGFATTDFGWAYETTGPNWYIWENGANPAFFAATPIVWMWRIGGTLYYGRGSTLAAAQAAPDRSVASAGTLYFDGFSGVIGGRFKATLYDLAPTTAYSMTADAMVITFNPQSTNLLVNYDLGAAVAAYSFNPQAVNLLRAIDMTAAVSTYSFSPQAANLLQGYDLAAAVATYSFSPQSAGMVTGTLMAAGAASYSFSPQAALLELGSVLTASTMTVTFSPQAVNLLHGYDLAAAAAVYSFNPQAIAFGITAHMPADTSYYAFLPQVARATINVDTFPFGTGGGGTSGVRVAAAFFRP